MENAYEYTRSRLESLQSPIRCIKGARKNIVISESQPQELSIVQFDGFTHEKPSASTSTQIKFTFVIGMCCIIAKNLMEF